MNRNKRLVSVGDDVLFAKSDLLFASGFLRQKGLMLIRPFLLAFTCTAIFMFPIVSSFMFRHPMFLTTIGFSLYDANFYVEPFFRKVACSRFV